MRRVLAAAVLVAFMPTANAQDKGKSDFTHNAEFRVRDTYEQNESGDSKMKPSHHNGIDQRFKLGLGFKANEKLSFNATLLQSGAWGQGDTDTLGNYGASSSPYGTEENFMSVNEAFATWMVSDDFSAKFGRMNFGFGDGSVMSVNDWEAQPNSFEGVVLGYEAEFGKFQVFGFKYRDMNTAASSATFSGSTNTSDPQHDAYGVVFDLKTMPEWLKSVNAFAIQDVADGVYGQTGSTIADQQSQNALRIGAGAGFAFSMVDLHADVVSVGGKNTDLKTSGDSTKHTIAQQMMQAEVGFNLPAFMSTRLYLGYHQDSGTKSGDAATKNNTYDPYFYEKHANAGEMDIVGWGNLTDTWLGGTMKPMDNTTVGLAYHMFSKTEKTDKVMAGTYGGNLGFSTNSSTKAKIGDEIDLWAEHKYANGLIMTARIGEFMPGDALKDTSLTSPRKDTITQAMLEAKMTF